MSATNNESKHPKPGDFAIVRYFESLTPAFEKFHLEVIANYNEFKVVTKADPNKVVYTCKSVQGLDGFLRGMEYERYTDSKLFKGSQE